MNLRGDHQRQPARAALGVVAISWLLGGVSSGIQSTIRQDAGRQAEVVAAHNAWRDRVHVPPLRWAPDLARDAEAWAAALARRGCRLQHPDTAADIGQNLYYASALRSPGGRRTAQAVTPAAVVGAWASEVRAYSYARNACAFGTTCGHYTQVVWRTTEEVGCGAALCQDLGQVWVCNYRPAGNIRGQRPY